MQSANFYARTTQYLEQQPDFKLRFQPLELQLKSKGGLSLLISQDKKIRYTKEISAVNLCASDVEQLQQQNGQTINFGNTQQNQFATNNQRTIQHQGLISEHLFQQSKQRRQQYYQTNNILETSQNNIEKFCQKHRLKVMICVTMYSEPRQELTNTIEGITKSLVDFYENQIFPHQIGVFVIFDGIENIKNDIDPNGKSYNTNIIPYFSDQFDKQFNLPKQKTLEIQYLKYKLHKQNIKQYSPDQIKFIQENNQLQNVFEKDKYLRQKFKSSGLYISDANIIRTMEYLFKESTDYIESRNNSAWVYQSVYKSTIDKIEHQTPIYYVFKYKNGSKLSSHMWFFRGFCQEMQPDYCLLMDAGATPGPGAICKLIMAMEKEPKIGGVCGTMRIQLEEDNQKEDTAMDMLTNILTNLLSIQKCQKCEYDIGHILDKQFESAFNYIHVLPGAFSAYRFKAFTTQYGEEFHQDQQNITDFYLKSILNPNYEHNNIQEANMFLAEDRVLCLLLFCNGYYLKYLRDAYVYVDPCISIFMLLMQRRRWINGSWFALNYVVDTFKSKLEKSNHDTWSQKVFYLSLVFAKIAQGKPSCYLGQQYFIVSFQVVWLYMILEAVFQTSDTYVSSSLKQIIVGFYVFLVLILVFLSLSYNPGMANKIKDEKVKEQEKKEIHYFFFSKFYGITTILGLISLANTAYTIYLLFSEIFLGGKILQFIDQKYVPASYLYFFVILSIGFSALPFFLWLFINPSMIFDIAANCLHYIYYQPTYTHLFLIYSFCRIDDLSWGTKGLVSDDNTNLSSDRQYQKYKFVAKWIISNSLLSTLIYILFYLDLTLIFQSLVLSFAILFTIIIMIKSIGASIYFFQYLFWSRNTNEQTKINRENKRKSSIRFYNRIEQNYRRNIQQIPEEEEDDDQEENENLPLQVI